MIKYDMSTLSSPRNEIQTREAISRTRHVLVSLIPRESSGYVTTDKPTVQKTFSVVHCDAKLYPISMSTEKKLTLVHMQVPRNPTLPEF